MAEATEGTETDRDGDRPGRADGKADPEFITTDAKHLAPIALNAVKYRGQRASCG